MQFIKSNNPDLGVQKFAQDSIEALRAGKKVLWLISGGSNIPVSTEIMNMIREDLTAEEIKNLTVMLADERFGPVGHENSNWQLLKDNGFDSKGITALPVLKDISLADTVRDYDLKMKASMLAADLAIGQFGIGTDGHIAGIFPDSPPAHLFESAPSDFISAYSSTPYTRVTITFSAFKKLHAAYTFVFGELKKEAVERLQNHDESFSKLPSMILYEVPKSFLYSDQIL